MRPRLAQRLWDLFCVTSVLGIWPRYVEPNILVTSRLDNPIPDLPPDLEGLRLLQFTDLHMNRYMTDTFLQKLQKRIMEERPDIILFGGDFLCYSKIPQPERLKHFLQTLHAPHGCFAIFGNHDYDGYVSLNDEGVSDVVSIGTPILAGLKKLFSAPRVAGRIGERARAVKCHPQLSALLKETPFEILENRCHLIHIGQAALNICGVGEYWAGKCHPEEAFKNYDTEWPGVVLAHNPDCFSRLKSYPGELILVGHTHGAQINLPLIRRKFLALEDPRFVAGLFREEGKTMYVNRGVGSTVPMRWFSLPEILVVTLTRAKAGV